MGYVYRFLDKDFNVIYVGRTLNIKSRMNSHFGSGGHLPSSVYQKVVRIDYMETKTQGDMKIKELYYISKYQPKYNTVDKGTVSIQLDELQDVWVSFKKDDVVKEMLDTEELIKSGKEKKSTSL
ncbi:nucleotide excision repair endonuclease [Exiguobacterium sp. s140]|uniref:nucleotide excision repair endonuclease n=1 Tax=Exiguobacterium sp. s140 TaxID=2751290 RepID=UPI001BEBFDC0|nr:nucleotide excision repair endonuclease [Exiguobacterium sp. s140]